MRLSYSSPLLGFLLFWFVTSIFDLLKKDVAAIHNQFLSFVNGASHFLFSYCHSVEWNRNDLLGNDLLHGQCFLIRVEMHFHFIYFNYFIFNSNGTSWVDSLSEILNLFLVPYHTLLHSPMKCYVPLSSEIDPFPSDETPFPRFDWCIAAFRFQSTIYSGIPSICLHNGIFA